MHQRFLPFLSSWFRLFCKFLSFQFSMIFTLFFFLVPAVLLAIFFLVLTVFYNYFLFFLVLTVFTIIFFLVLTDFLQLFFLFVWAAFVLSYLSSCVLAVVFCFFNPAGSTVSFLTNCLSGFLCSFQLQYKFKIHRTYTMLGSVELQVQ